MPFKIVETTEKGTPLLTTVPAQWEQRGTLYWPRKNEAILIKAEDSTPETNWKSMPCILKRNNIPNYESSEQQISLMSDMSDTDTDQENIAKTQRPKKSTTQINLNDLVTINCLSVSLLTLLIYISVIRISIPMESALKAFNILTYTEKTSFLEALLTDCKDLGRNSNTLTP